MPEWYYTRNLQQAGPVELAELQRMVAAGEVGPAELVWKDGMPDWQPPGAVAELAGIAPVVPYGGYNPQSYGNPGQSAGTVNYYNAQGDTFVYAGFWLRFVAYIVDWLVIVLPFLILNTVVRYTIIMPAGRTTNLRLILSYSILSDIASLMASWLYYALQESSSKQATLGKRALGLRVVDGSGQRLTFGRATGRYFGKIISFVTVLIGYIMAGFTEKKQALHDIIAGTLVIRA